MTLLLRKKLIKGKQTRKDDYIESKLKKNKNNGKETRRCKPNLGFLWTRRIDLFISRALSQSVNIAMVNMLMTSTFPSCLIEVILN